MPYINKKLAGMRILAADDNDINRMFLHGVLTPAVASLEICEDGEETLIAARQKPYDVILLDLHMPGYEGLQVMQQLRQELSTPQPLFIALTADARKTEQDRLLAAGFDGFLTKPIQANDLISGIEIINEHPGQPLQVARRRLHISAQLHDARALNALNNDLGLLYDLRRKLLTELPAAINEINALATANHWDQVAANAHKLGGGAAYTGAETLAEACRKLELSKDKSLPQRHLAHLHFRHMAMHAAVLIEQSLYAG